MDVNGSGVQPVQMQGQMQIGGPILQNGGPPQMNQMQDGYGPRPNYEPPPGMMDQNMMQNAQMQNLIQQQQQQQMMQGHGHGQMDMGGMHGMGGYGFAARPQLIKHRKYRDPYREYIKVAPQNIMYDRRIVRGNTFAALVIPVNMQPDPALIEKQRMEEAYMHQRQEEMRQRRNVQERQRQREREDEQEQNMQMQQMTRANNWEELSDRDNFIPETEIPPDYYIDRPPTAIYVPTSQGDSKGTQIFEGEPELIDYENEVEAILQVLVGKSIEHARVEVIEDHENANLRQHKSEYQQVREAELMETQRLEEMRGRKNDEIDRRNMQIRIAKNQNQLGEKKLISRQYAKNYLATFKTDTLKKLTDLGILRRPRELYTGLNFVPEMYNQIHHDMQSNRDNLESLDDYLGESMRNVAIRHKQSIVKELNRRQELKKEELRKKKEAEDAKKRRKDRRAALRERKRLENLRTQIMDAVTTPAEQKEYSTTMKVYDVRDPATTNDGIVLIGGFVGELIISFTCMLDYILADPKHQNFFFSDEMMEQFLFDLLNNDDYPDGICALTVNKSVEEMTQGRDLAPPQIAKLVREKQNLVDFGLKYMFDITKELVLVADVIDVLFATIVKFATRKPVEIQAVPEAPEEGQEENFEEFVGAIKEANASAEIENAKYAKISQKIVLKVRLEEDYNEESEKALIRLNNYRETKVNEIGEVVSARDSAPLNEEGMEPEEAEPSFNPDDIPTKLLITKPQIGDTGDVVALYHPEAAYLVRKSLMEAARKNFKELEKAEMTQLLLHSYQRSTMLETKFEEKFIKQHNYERGCMYTDPNFKFLFKTFLKD